jgi:pimeloyl-ACP methyl ester carboxylesterase
MKPIQLCLLTLAGLLLSSLAQSTSLRGQPMFGVMGQAAEPGVEVQMVLEQSTAAVMGLKTGDIITTFNQQPVNSFPQLVELINALNVGDQLTIELIRDQQASQLSGQVLSRPREQDERFRVLYDEVKTGNNTLRSIVYQPNDLQAGDQRPALFYIQGYTCQSIDHAMVPQLTIQQLLSEVATHGYVVYKIEKFGVGDSQGELACSQVNFSQELAGFKAGLRALKAYDFVDADAVFLFGHSLGGVYAPLVDEGSQFKGIALYGAVLKPWYDYLLDMFSEQAVMMGTPKATAAENTRLIQPLLHAWLNTDLSWESITADPQMADAFAANLLPHQGDQVFQRHHSFFRDLNRYDLAKAWRQVTAPVLVLHGAHDIQTISDQWAKDLTALLNADSPGQATLEIFDNTDHGLMKHDSFEALRQAMQEGRYNPAQPGEHYNQEVAQTLIKWMDRSQKG